jgi:hypothetical protein
MLVVVIATAVIVVAPVAIVVIVPVVIVLADHAVALAVRSDDATGGQNQEPGDHAALDESIQCVHGMPRFCVFHQATLIGSPPGRGSV